jgi:hypothetical protein
LERFDVLKRGREMIVEKRFPRRNRIAGGRGPNLGGGLRLIEEPLANVAALVALILMSGAGRDGWGRV